MLLLLAYSIHLLQHELAVCKDLILSIKEENASLIAKHEILVPRVEARLAAEKRVIQEPPLYAGGALHTAYIGLGFFCLLFLVTAVCVSGLRPGR